MITWHRLALGLGSVLAFAACSGGGGAPAPAPVATTSRAPAPSAVPAGDGTVSFVVLVPKAPANVARRPAYISSGTQSMQISTNGAVTATIELTSTSPGCVVVSSGVQCTVMANAPAGTDAFSVVTYDQANAAGNVLSRGSVSSTIVAATQNTVMLTLTGVVASVKITMPPIPTCTATAVPLQVDGVDAAGYTIVGAQPYASPITLKLTSAKNSSASSITGPTTISAPGGSTTVTYDGGYEPGSTITATSGASVSAYTFFPTPTVCNQYPVVTATFPHINGITTGSDGNLYVGSYNTSQMIRIAPTGATIGRGVPIDITSGPAASSAHPLQAVTGPDNNLWIADGTNAIDELGVPAFPVQSNYGAATYQEAAVAVGPDGRLWFTNFRLRDVQAITTAGVLTSYPLTTGDGRDPEGIVAGLDGAMWFTEDSSTPGEPGIIGRISTDGTGYTEYPVPLLPTTSSRPQDITVGGDGNLWFDDRSADAIGRLTPGGTFTIFPIPDGANGLPYGMTTGPDGNIWFVGDNTTVGGYVGRITLAGVITQYVIPNTTDLTGPFQITVTPDDNLWFTETYGGTASDGQVGYLVI